MIPLAPPLDSTRAEISDLAWLGDELLLLPQFPARLASGTRRGSGGSLFALSAKALRGAVDHVTDAPLAPREIPFDTNGVEARIDGFDGYEALAVKGDEAFFAIEARQQGGTVGYLVRGHVLPGPRITLDAGLDAVVKIAPPVSITNVGFEALTLDHGALLALFEVNGASLVSRPVARRFTSGFSELSPFSLAPLDYRVTAATSVDAKERLWVINYFWPGEPALARPDDDAHARATSVEQLVELVVRDGHVERTARAPLRLTPDGRGRARNWEGVVRFEGRGFLIAVDEHPETMLGFVEATDVGE